MTLAVYILFLFADMFLHRMLTALSNVWDVFFKNLTSLAHPEEAEALKKAEQRALRPGDGVQLPPLPGLHQRAQQRRCHPGHGAQTQRPPKVHRGRAYSGAAQQAQREAQRETNSREV